MLSELLEDRCQNGHAMCSIGATQGWYNKILFPNVKNNMEVCLEPDLDAYMVSGTFAEASKGVSPEHFLKIWRIDHATAKQTIDIITQLVKRSTLDHLSRNYSTNDRLLRYKKINQHFFMDTSFATSKAKATTRGFTCMQLFVSDKSYMFVVPLKSKLEVPQAIKLFAKEVGAPDAIICDASQEQTLQTVKTFLQATGMALRTLEENTPWANRAELYVGLLKEAVCQDMKDTNCPLLFWDYCTERRVCIHNLTSKDLFS